MIKYERSYMISKSQRLLFVTSFQLNQRDWLILGHGQVRHNVPLDRRELHVAQLAEREEIKNEG